MRRTDQSLAPPGNGRRSVAITGLGVVSCIGSTVKDVADALRNGRSGIVLDEGRRRLGFRSALTGRIANFEPEKHGITLKMLRTMPEPAQYAYVAVRNALSDSGLRPEDWQNERCGIVFGNDSTIQSAVEAIEALHTFGETHFLGGGSVFRSMNSTVTMNLATLLNLGGANWTVSAACASSAHAIGQALMLIRMGLQDIVIAGGAQETDWRSMASFDALGAFSTRHDDPPGASRPFDRDRDGLVPSGGAAGLVLEELEHALARHAPIFGLVRGYGFSSGGGGHLSQTSAQAIARAMTAALADADVAPGAIDYVNAHATSTPAGDREEATAIAKVLGLSVPVSSTKSMTGHECWMSGASEVVYTTLMAQGGFIAPNINFVRRDPDVPAINVVSRTTERHIRFAMSNSFGFGGTNAVLLLDYPESDCLTRRNLHEA